MKINIAASGRFHLCDLAQELEKQGHEIRFYSFVPTRRLQKFGLNKKCSYSLFWIMLPVLACIKLSHRSVWAMKLEWFVLDHIVGLFMKKCDVFIAMSSIYSYAFKKAKHRFNAITILERGSVHALALKEIYDKQGFERNKTKNNPYYSLVSDYAIQRELEMYKFVDYISIASSSVYDTFMRFHVPHDKLFVNPYGVNLSIFPPTELDKDSKDVYDIIMVGNWSWMKGCDLLAEACRRLNLKLLHVGSHSMEFPNDPLFKDVGTVDQSIITNYFKKAKIFVLSSRQEGLALVQLQAIASGLPVVCSKYTGGETLKNMLFDSKWIKVFSPYTVESLCKCINEALKLSEEQKGIRCYVPDIDGLFGSRAYALRYNKFLSEIKHD